MLRHSLVKGLILTVLFGSAALLQGEDGALLTYGQANPPSFHWYDFEPRIVPLDRNDPVIFSVQISGNPTRVVLAYDRQLTASEIELFDNGATADARAGDGIYTAVIPAVQITSNLAEDDVSLPFLGFLELYTAQGLYSRGNIFVEVRTPDIPVYEIFSTDGDMRYTNQLVNIVEPGFYSGVDLNYDAYPLIAQRFYRYFGDDYDFLHIVATPKFFANRFHFQVRNDVTGIGLDIFDNSLLYGSFGRLQGISVFPNTSFYDGAGEGVQHELAHQWINFLNNTPFGAAVPHWPLSSAASGIMGWSLPGSSAGGEFPCLLEKEGDQVRLNPRNEPPQFTDIDLYLMGLLPADAVGTQLVFADQGFDAFNQILSSCDGSLYERELLEVEVESVLSAYGARIPEASAPQTFRIATIVVSRDEPLSADELDYYSYFTERAMLEHEVLYREAFGRGFAKPFFITTRGMARLDTRLIP